MDERESKIIEETAKQLPTKEIYRDIGNPVLKPSGELLGLVPRTINAALEPLHEWILQKEYNIERTKMLLENKLQDVSPENIITPEPYVAIPAFQAISYSINNDLLKNLYANLLASAMDKTKKDYVHPSYTEIIKQLSPDEAKVLNIISKQNIIPVLWVRKMNKNDNGGWYVVRNFTLINEKANCDVPDRIPAYLENLERLKLININQYAHLTSEGAYDDVENHPYIKNLIEQEDNDYEYKTQRGYLEVSLFGQSFCEICC